MAEMLRANIDWKSAFLKWASEFRSNFYVHAPQTIFAWIDGPVNALQLCHWEYSHKETL